MDNLLASANVRNQFDGMSMTVPWAPEIITSLLCVAL